MLTVGAVVVSNEARRIAPGRVDDCIHICIVHGLYQPLHTHSGCVSGCRASLETRQARHEQCCLLTGQQGMACSGARLRGHESQVLLLRAFLGILGKTGCMI